jgi:hypothetical protein
MENPKTLSDNQKKFVRAAERKGLEVYYSYSGRCMYGDTCPAVDVNSLSDFKPRANFRTDNMGLGYVIYAPY